jgi:hypothetical protein
MKWLQRWTACTIPECKRLILAGGLCRMHYKRQRRIDEPEQHLGFEMRQYGVTAQWYHEQYERQRGLCAICGRPEWATRNGKVKRLCVDHDHITGAARALLCTSCNMKIGILEDIAWQATAVAYCDMFSIEVSKRARFDAEMYADEDGPQTQSE